MTDVNETLNMLRRVYLKKLEKDVIEIEEYRQEFHTMQTCLELLEIVHKITGTGGMYGFQKLSDVSAELEETLTSIKKKEEKINQEKINEQIDALISSIYDTVKEGINA